jgi:glyoxylate utilization-related uncharacterized protein
VDRRDLTDLIRFSDDGPRIETLLETERLWSQVVCLQGAQGIGPLSDARADGLLIVLAGEVAVQIGRRRSRLKQWGSVIVPAAESLTVRNASEEPGVVLIVTAPPPAAEGSSSAASAGGEAQAKGPEAIT